MRTRTSSSRLRRRSSTQSTAASPRPTGGRPSSASATPRTCSRSPAARSLRVTPRGGYRFVVVAHTPWDREWYLPLEHFRLELARTVDEIVDTLERDRRFR